MKQTILILMLASMVRGATEISSLPATLSTNNETYYLTQNLTCASGTALRVTAVNVKISGNGHTITYGTSGASSCITISQHQTKLIIDSLNGIQGHLGIYFFSNSANWRYDSLIIRNCKIRSDSAALNDGVIYSENLSGVSHVNIRACSLWVNAPAKGVCDGIALQGSAGQVWGKITKNYIYLGDSVWAGRSSNICMEVAKCYATIDSNHIVMRQGYQGEGIVCDLSQCAIIRYNTINQYSHNSRGITLNENTDSILCEYNNINMNINACPAGYDCSQSYGIRIRFGADYCKIRNNTIVATGVDPNCIAIGGAEVKVGNQPCLKDSIYNNVLTSSYHCIYIYDGTLDTTYIVKNKLTMTTTNSHYKLSTSNDPAWGTKGILIVRDTCYWAGTTGPYNAIFNSYSGHPLQPINFIGCNFNSTKISGTLGTDYVLNAQTDPLRNGSKK